MDKETVTPKGIWILALFPICMFILDPYAVSSGGFAICDVLIFAMVFYLIASYKLALYKPMFVLLIVDVFLSLISLTLTNSVNTNPVLSVKVSIVFMLYLIVYSGVWAQIVSREDTFYKAVEIIGLVCAALAIMQFVFASAGVDFYDGKLPLPIGKNTHFGGLFDAVTGDLRVHSFFEEPSYLAFFEIPITIHFIQKKKYVKSVICGSSCFLSGSMIGILGLLISLAVFLVLDSDVKTSTKIRFAVIVAILIIGVKVLYEFNDSVKGLFDYYLRRINNVDVSSQRDDSSFSYRITGNLYLFERYSDFNKIFGVGFNQYMSYFGLSIDYSNDIISNLLNFGYIGITALFFTLVSIAKKASGHGRVFFVIFIILLAVDHSWFGAMFFYILTWVVVKSDYKRSNAFLGVEAG